MLSKNSTRAGQQCPALFVCIVTLLVFLLNGCSTGVLSSSKEASDRIARQHQWQKLTLQTKSFYLRGFLRRQPQNRSRQLAVYIEEDGYAWINEYTISSDPTPYEPLVLKLAVRHPAGAALYLARPCQFITGPVCHPRYWTIDRYAPIVVDAMNEAIDEVKRQVGAASLKLIGFSGGGTIAALLAARRKDVDEVITLGANLDHAYWTKMERVSPLTGSLNPVDYAQTLQRVPQRHFIGAEDDAVKPRVVESYINKMTDTSKTKLFILKNFDHDCCWLKNWPQMLDWH